jgi:selenide,water dikinase
MASGSGVSIRIRSTAVPLLAGAYALVDMGCIPGASFKNLRYIDPYIRFAEGLDYNLKMLLVDAQTSGGLLLSCPKELAETIAREMRDCGYPATAVIGTVEKKIDGQPAVMVE